MTPLSPGPGIHPAGSYRHSHMARAVSRFHALHPDLALEVNVTRYPYSFVGDRQAQPQRKGELDGVGTQALRTFGEQMQGRFPAP